MIRPHSTAQRPWLWGFYALVPIVLWAATRGLWAPDEPRYAEVAREAFERDLLVMHLNGELYYAKPPLVYWLSGFMGSVCAWSELALRVPSLVATLLTALLARRLARRLWGESEASWTPLLFLATPMVLEIGGRLQLDPVLCCACFAAVVFAHEAPASSAPASSGVGRTRAEFLVWMCAAGLCAGLGALAKGPVAWLHVGTGILALRLVRARSAAPSVSFATRALASFAFVGLALAPVLVWALAASAREPALYRALFFGEHIGRVVDGTQHRGPPWEHLLHFPLLFLPWTPLLALALAGAWRDARLWRRASEIDFGRLALALWFAIEFVVFSAMPPKRDLYLLPIYPVAALLGARVLARSFETRSAAPGIEARWMRVPAALLGFVGGLIALAGAALAAGGAQALGELAQRLARVDGDDLAAARELVEPLGAALLVVGLALAAGCALAWRSLARRDVARASNELAAGLCAAWALFALLCAPALDSRKSARELALWLAARPEKPSAISCMGVQPEGFRFYGRLPAVKEDLAIALEREGDRFLALVAPDDLARLSPQVRDRTRVLDARAAAERGVVVLGRAPGR